MKKCRWIILLSSIVIILTVCCLNFHRKAKQEYEKMEQLCQYSVVASLEEFREYVDTGDELLYQYGVAEFHCFMKSYRYLKDEYITEANGETMKKNNGKWII